MQPPSASELLRSWVQGLSLPLHERALLLLEVAYPETHADNLAQLSIGRRDALLLQLRESLFGSQVTSQAVCPHCGEQLELNSDIASLLIDEPPAEDTQLSLEVDGRNVVFRLPDSLDLREVIAEPDVSARHRVLLQRCISFAVADDSELTAEDLPTAVAEAVVSRMAELDPQAHVEIDVACPSCRHRWLAPFDIVSFLWAEINAWAKRILQEVHVLAGSYGWSERDILRMQPAKRQLYLQMVWE